ncbi:unnamed protein product [Prunus armeniaca]
MEVWALSIGVEVWWPCSGWMGLEVDEGVKGGMGTLAWARDCRNCVIRAIWVSTIVTFAVKAAVA